MKEQTIAQLMHQSQVDFGTSGVRGLVIHMNDSICYLYTQGVLQYLKDSGDDLKHKKVAIAGDLRSSTPRIINAIAQAVLDCGYTPILCGLIPTPALSCYAFEKEIPSIMVTGSHIPDNRNGIKFNRAYGELLKSEEAPLKAQSVSYSSTFFDQNGDFTKPISSKKFIYTEDANKCYQKRFRNSFSDTFLTGFKIGFFQHSAVGRDILPLILTSLGAQVVPVGYSQKFVSVDTEAIRPEDLEQAPKWIKQHQLDILVSTDGDSDRPLIFDEQGQWVRGDVAGTLVCQFLKADFVATPISCNTNLEKSNLFKQMKRTRIGSPFVIEAMQAATLQHFQRIMGYEANGGFLLQSNLPELSLKPLATRDALIVFIAILGLAKQKKCTVSKLVHSLPSRHTMSQRIENVPIEKSKKIFHWILQHQETAFKSLSGKLAQVNQMDGLRLTFKNNEIIHLRPSGNAPELRCYNEANSIERVETLNSQCLNLLQKWINL